MSVWISIVYWLSMDLMVWLPEKLKHSNDPAHVERTEQEIKTAFCVTADAIENEPECMQTELNRIAKLSP